MDSYETAIYTFSDLSDSQKFTYLRSYLKDAVLKSIGGSTLTNENYWKFLTILNERHGNKQAIVSTYMEKLANLQFLNITGLEKLFDEIESNVRSLESLEVEEKANNCGSLLVSVIMNRLPH